MSDTADVEQRTGGPTSVVVVSDTSPVRALSYLGRLDLLELLFGEVVIPPTVAAELARHKPSEPAIDLASVTSIRIQAPSATDRVQSLAGKRLDVGEAEAIALAVELQADLLLIDERRGDLVARNAGLTTIGVLGLLVRAKQAGGVDRLAPLIERLRTGLNFYLSDALQQQVLRLAGE